jgi:uncharacterized membrane protein YhaH (DUF805 family)
MSGFVYQSPLFSEVPLFWLMIRLMRLLGQVLFLLFPASIVLLIVGLARKGDEGPNKYGPDPRQATSLQPYKP